MAKYDSLDVVTLFEAGCQHPCIVSRQLEGDVVTASFINYRDGRHLFPSLESCAGWRITLKLLECFDQPTAMRLDRATRTVECELGGVHLSGVPLTVLEIRLLGVTHKQHQRSHVLMMTEAGPFNVPQTYRVKPGQALRGSVQRVGHVFHFVANGQVWPVGQTIMKTSNYPCEQDAETWELWKAMD
jgi:hypothetical protein